MAKHADESPRDADDPKGRSPALDGLLRDAPATPDRDSLDAMFASLEERIDAEAHRPGHRLRQAPTRVRRGLAIGSFVLVALVVAKTTLRPDLALYSPLRLAAELLAFFVLGAACLFVALRPAYVPSLSRGRALALVAASLAAGFVVAVLPAPHPVPPELLRFMGDDRWLASSPCLYIGLLLGLPVYLVARVLDRDTPLSSTLAATAAGLAGNLVLELHCPDTSVHHRLTAHAPVTLVFLACLGIAYFFERFVFVRRAP